MSSGRPGQVLLRLPVTRAPGMLKSRSLMRMPVDSDNSIPLFSSKPPAGIPSNPCPCSSSARLAPLPLSCAVIRGGRWPVVMVLLATKRLRPSCRDRTLASTRSCRIRTSAASSKGSGGSLSVLPVSTRFTSAEKSLPCSVVPKRMSAAGPCTGMLASALSRYGPSVASSCGTVMACASTRAVPSARSATGRVSLTPASGLNGCRFAALTV